MAKSPLIISTGYLTEKRENRTFYEGVNIGIANHDFNETLKRYIDSSYLHHGDYEISTTMYFQNAACQQLLDNRLESRPIIPSQW